MTKISLEAEQARCRGITVLRCRVLTNYNIKEGLFHATYALEAKGSVTVIRQ